jgi:hypothetical protein
VRTIGAVSFTGLTNANRFNINAGQAIEVDPARGSIALSNASGGLGGNLQLTSEDIVAASSAALADIIAAPSVKAINDRLTRNDGAINEQGVFSAQGITFTVGKGLYIQNTGRTPTNPRVGFDDRRGVTVGTGGIRIITGGPATRIVISGRQVSGAGGFTTGLKMIPLVQISAQSGAIAFDPDSTINGCTILRPATCQVSFDQLNIIRDTINVARDKASGPVTVNMLQFGLIELKDVVELLDNPIIDDPVTGAGNDDLWAVDDDQDAVPR